MKKYELTSESIKHLSKTLYRIKRLSDGLLGGYIESENNLSQEGSCFVYDSAKVFGKAKVFGEAMVYGEARVLGRAMVYGKARVLGRAVVYGKACVFGEAEVCGKAWVFGEAWVSGEAKVFGEAWVSGEAKVFGKAKATGLVQTAILLKHNVTMTDNYIAIGCENRPIKCWFKNIVDIGKEYGYTDKEIKAVKHVLKGMLILKKENKK